MSENYRGGYDEAANAANELSYENEKLQSENKALKEMLERMAGKLEYISHPSSLDAPIAAAEARAALAEYQKWKDKTNL